MERNPKFSKRNTDYFCENRIYYEVAPFLHNLTNEVIETCYRASPIHWVPTQDEVTVKRIYLERHTGEIRVTDRYLAVKDIDELIEEEDLALEEIGKVTSLDKNVKKATRRFFRTLINGRK